MLERSSAIASGLARGGRRPNGEAGCVLAEVRGWSLLQVAGFGAGMARVEDAIAAHCGGRAPGKVGEVGRAGALMMMRTGPQQVWIIGPGEALAIEPSLRSDIATGIGAVISLSHSRTRMAIEGPRSRDVLAKGIALDLHPGVFAIDRFALTGLDHTPILLHRAGPDRYEIYAMRTFALTVWDWLADAALQFGFDVAKPASP